MGGCRYSAPDECLTAPERRAGSHLGRLQRPLARTGVELVAYPFQHRLLTFHGTFGTSVETWQFGLRMGAETGDSEPTQGMVDAAFTAAKSWYSAASTAGGYFPTSDSITFAKLAVVNPDGKYPSDFVPLVSTGAAATGGFSGAVIFPPQIACVATLRTDVPRGYANSGRVYLPRTGIALQTDSTITTANATNIATLFAGFIRDLNNIAGLGRVLVLSKVQPAGGSHAVTRVEVGRVLDTQRRRRRAIPEARSGVAVPTS